MRSLAYVLTPAVALFLLSPAWGEPATEPAKAVEKVYAELKANGTFNALNEGWLVAAEAVEGKKLVKVMLVKKSNDGYPGGSVAEEAEFRPSSKQGMILLVLRKGRAKTSDDSSVSWDERTIELPMPSKR